MSSIQQSINHLTGEVSNAYIVHQARKEVEKKNKNNDDTKRRTDAIVRMAENMEWMRQNAITRADMLKKNRETATAQSKQRKHKFDQDIVGGMYGNQ